MVQVRGRTLEVLDVIQVTAVVLFVSLLSAGCSVGENKELPAVQCRIAKEQTITFNDKGEKDVTLRKDAPALAEEIEKSGPNKGRTRIVISLTDESGTKWLGDKVVWVDGSVLQKHNDCSSLTTEEF